MGEGRSMHYHMHVQPDYLYLEQTNNIWMDRVIHTLIIN